jgi:transposase-like protein
MLYMPHKFNADRRAKIPKQKRRLTNCAGCDESLRRRGDLIKIYEPKYPKAALCLQKDREELMAFFDFPAQHWQTIRTSNPIECKAPAEAT